MSNQTGVEIIAAERARQVEVEKWSEGHDDEHTEGQLGGAAACYAIVAYAQMAGWVKGSEQSPAHYWRWDRTWWKPSDDVIRNLARAGALIAAEIDRIQRAKVEAPYLLGPKEGS